IYAHLNPEDQKRVKLGLGRADAIVFWVSDSRGQPCNGGQGPARSPGFREQVPGPLAICTRQALHGTLNPKEYRGDRVFLVALFGEVQARGDKRAALTREILAE